MLLCVRDLPTRGTLHADRSVGVTPAAVAKASGLARSSVYPYFPTTGALLAVAIEDAFAVTQERLDSALTVAGDDVEARLPGADADVLAGLASGALNGAALLVEHGASLPNVTAETVRFITAGLR